MAEAEFMNLSGMTTTVGNHESTMAPKCCADLLIRSDLLMSTLISRSASRFGGCHHAGMTMIERGGDDRPDTWTPKNTDEDLVSPGPSASPILSVLRCAGRCPNKV
jgi:hypothetical protein